jgi:SAM-dependent methyltransferase
MNPFDHAASFGRQAAAYARHRPTYPDALFDWLADVSPARAAAVDVATGAGQAALALADRFDAVLATDMSDALVAAIPPHPHLRTRVQAAVDLTTDAPVDLVATFQALHWFAGDPFWAAVRRALRPGGVFAAATYGWFFVDPAVDACSAALRTVLAPHWSPRNQLLFDGYRTLDIPFAPLAVPDFAITLTWTRADLLRYLGTWSAVVQLRESGRDVLAELAPRLEEVWPGEDARVVRMPLAVRAFRV